MRIAIHVIIAAAVLQTVAQAQWYRFDLIAAQPTAEVISDLRINDHGDTLYLHDTNPFLSSGTRIAYLNGEAVLVARSAHTHDLPGGGAQHLEVSVTGQIYDTEFGRGGDASAGVGGALQTGDINNDKVFAFTGGVNGVYTLSPDGTVTEYGAKDTYKLAFLGTVRREFVRPRIDATSVPYFMANTSEFELGLEFPFRPGTVDQFNGPDPIENFIFGTSSVIFEGMLTRWDSQWDINDRGDLVSSGLFVPAGESMRRRFHPTPIPQINIINNHGVYAQATWVDLPDGNRAAQFTVLGETTRVFDLPVVDTFRPTGSPLFFDKYPIEKALINDQGLIAFSTDEGVYILDTADGSIDQVYAVQEGQSSGVRNLQDFNDVGQLGIQIADGSLYLVTPTDQPTGDVNLDGLVTPRDVDELFLGIDAGSTEVRLDLNKDGVLSAADATHWVEINNTVAGDTDLDGDVDFRDFLVLSENFGSDGGWSKGNFNGRSGIQFDDFLQLQANFGFKQGRAVIVPEPQGLNLFFVLSVFLLAMRGRLQCEETRYCAAS